VRGHAPSHTMPSAAPGSQAQAALLGAGRSGAGAVSEAGRREGRADCEPCSPRLRARRGSRRCCSAITLIRPRRPRPSNRGRRRRSGHTHHPGGGYISRMHHRRALLNRAPGLVRQQCSVLPPRLSFPLSSPRHALIGNMAPGCLQPTQTLSACWFHPLRALET